ncbi:Heavy-metal-associated domain-containing protein [Draconibacterium orientale]|jgi:copper chaperone CopZ|uniref:Heavy metal-binding protein n=1 Tax=Draconibacterium orientale TaxID=1168034 RepID=X5E364_9BACT|nr:heavy-metal-associated domain-containing protein [Draconibacterium orientale]AHW61061.1 heavy metal-binding protein [Draconibacterium orientale]SET70459.1 Heavy-metal-associated domain-containing protein [Draconibacterium orientale]
MKKLILLVTMAMFIGFAGNETFAQKKENKVVCFKSNMDCADCEKTVTEYLKFEKGVKDLKVDHASNTILVEYKDGKNSDEKLAAAIEKKGYKADKITQKEYEEIVAHAQGHGHEHNHEVHKERE